MESSPMPGKINCSECGRLIDGESEFCQFCGFAVPDEEKKKETERELAAEEESFLPILGGILIIISSVMLFATTLIIGNIRENYAGDIWIVDALLDWPEWAMVILMGFAVVGMFGGISAMLRKSQVFALVGGTLSCFGFGFAIGVVGLLLVAVSEDQFGSQLSDLTELPGTIEDRTLEKPGFGWRR